MDMCVLKGFKIDYCWEDLIVAVQNIELYEFLKERENHLYMHDGKLRAWSCIALCDVEEFNRIIPEGHFDDGGMEVRLFDYYIAVDIDEVLSYEGETLWEYRRCFEEDEVERFKNELIKEHEQS